MSNAFTTEAQRRRASQCWASPWRVAEREDREQLVTRSFLGADVSFPVVLEHPMPTRLVRLSVDEMQRLAMGMNVKVGKDTLS